MPDPLILTAGFDAAATTAFQQLRDRHFPPARNIVPAHCTLFHHLPGGVPSVVDALEDFCGAEPRMAFVTGVPRFLGRGVALPVVAASLAGLHARLAARWHDVLTAQDRQRYRPHVTIQNKEDPAEARALHARLMAGPPSITGAVEGLALWHYRGGPWEPAGFFPFAG